MIDEATLKEIEAMAELQFTRGQVFTIINNPVLEGAFFAVPDKRGRLSGDAAEINNALNRGWLKSEAELRKSIRSRAVQGATNAQKIMLDLVEERRLSEE